MTGQDGSGQGGILRRKLAARRDSAATGGDWAARAWRVALPRAAREGIGLDLAIPGLRDERQSLTELLDLIPDRALLALLEGHGHGLGLMVVSAEVLAAVIEVQTLGRLAPPAARARKPTRTDAALSAGLIDKALTLLELALAEAADLTWAGGFRYASFLDEPRALGLLLEDLPYRLLRCEVEIGGSQRQGEVLLALPAEGRGPRPQAAPPPPDGSQWQAQLQSAVMSAEVAMTATAGRIRLTLGQVRALAPGMVLRLSDGGLDRIALLGSGGETAGQGRLGQYRGLRAVKLGAVPERAARPPPPPAMPTPADPATADMVTEPPPVARSA